jgi:hypothetical protein
MTFRQGDDTGIWKRKHYFALSGELALEEAMELSWGRLHCDDDDDDDDIVFEPGTSKVKVIGVTETAAWSAPDGIWGNSTCRAAERTVTDCQRKHEYMLYYWYPQCLVKQVTQEVKILYKNVNFTGRHMSLAYQTR